VPRALLGQHPELMMDPVVVIVLIVQLEKPKLEVGMQDAEIAQPGSMLLLLLPVHAQLAPMASMPQ
jgi:hypothetical protein